MERVVFIEMVVPFLGVLQYILFGCELLTVLLRSNLIPILSIKIRCVGALVLVALISCFALANRVVLVEYHTAT